MNWRAVPLAALARSGASFARDFARYAGRRGAAALGLTLSAALLENVGVLLLVPFLAAATQTGAGDMAAPAFAMLGLATRRARLAALLLVFALLLTLRAGANAARARALVALRLGFVEQRRARLLRALAAAPWESVAKLQHGRIGQIVHVDILQTGIAINVLLDSVVAAVLLVNQAAVALWLAPAFTLICLAAIGVAAPAALVLLRRSYGAGVDIGAGGQTLAHSLGQFLGALKLAVSQNLQARFVAQFETAIAAILRRQTSFLLQTSDSQQLVGLVTGLAGCLCAFVGFGLFDLPAPVVLTLMFVLARLSGPAQTLLRAGQQFAHALPAYERVCGLERDMAPAAGSRSSNASGPAPVGPIRFRAVAYLHDSGAGLRDVDLDIAPGEIVGVTGPSGAGKTTFADLLVGLVAPQTGAISIGDAPLRGAALTAWRSGLAYVAQDAFLFHDTLRANLQWADPNASDADLRHALAIVGATRVVDAMPEGLETIVGERGARLSGGERQRIALARALLRRPQLLVLDEATSALDLASETEILARFAALDQAPTIVVIAHRPESLRICTRILRFDDGRLVDDAASASLGEAPQ